MKIFRIFAILAMAAAIGLPAYADEPSQKTKDAVKQELEWLKAEAEGTVTIATRTKMSVNDAPSIVSVITADEIKNSGAKNLEEVLRQVAGFNVYESPRTPGIIIGIRGLGDESNAGVKIMVNGHSLEMPASQNADRLSAFPIGLIKKIEIIRGPGSALYGSDAMNGVINIITKDAKDPSEISVSYGSFDTYEGTGQLSYSKNDFSLFFFADVMGSKGDPQFIGKDDASVLSWKGSAPGYNKEDFDRNAFFAKLSYRNFYLTSFYKEDTGEPAVGRLGFLTDENTTFRKVAYAEAGYNGSPADRTGLSARIYYDYSQLSIDYELYGDKTVSSPPFRGFPQGEGAIGRVIGKEDKVGGELTVNIKPADSLDMVAGISAEYSERFGLEFITNTNIVGNMVLDGIPYAPLQYLGGIRDVSSQYLTEDPANRTSYSGYVQGTWNAMKTFSALEGIGKNLTVTGGLRYDNYNDAGNSVNPRFGLVYAPNNTLFFKLLYGTAFRAPGFLEMYVKNNPVLKGNPDLKPETIKTAEIQAGVNLTEHITATLNFFNVRKEDTILVYQGQYANWGKIESQGAEGEIRVSFDKNKYGYFNVTFQKAKDTTHDVITDLGGTAYTQEDYNLGMYPQVMANLGVNSDISRYVNANVSVNYVGSMERIGQMQFTASKTDPDGTVQKTDQRDAVGSYALFNLSLIFHNFDFAKGWELQLTGYNLFNADQRDPEQDGLIPNDYPRWGRNFMGKVTYIF